VAQEKQSSVPTRFPGRNASRDSADGLARDPAALAGRPRSVTEKEACHVPKAWRPSQRAAFRSKLATRQGPWRVDGLPLLKLWAHTAPHQGHALQRRRLPQVRHAPARRALLSRAAPVRVLATVSQKRRSVNELR